MVGIQPF